MRQPDKETLLAASPSRCKNHMPFCVLQGGVTMQASRSKLWRPGGNCKHDKLCPLEGAAPHLMLTMCFLSNCTRCPRCRPCILVTLLTICERRVRVRRWSLVN